MDKTFPDIVKGTKGKLFDEISEGRFKDWLWWQYMRDRWTALQNEIKLLRIEGMWIDKDLYCVRSNGINFYGAYTSKYDRRAYPFLSRKIKEKVPLAYLGIVTDIITRYIYPQAIPIAPPYPQRHRLGLSWHHTETISDMDITVEEKLLLNYKFRLKPDDIVLDVGAYIGYGSMGMASRILGPGRVIAFECNPEVFKVFRRNLGNNKNSSIVLIKKAAWKDNKGMSLSFEGEPQERSLTEGSRVYQVETVTIDFIVERLSLPKVDFISLSINGAELEALEGMQGTLEQFHPRLSIPGWVHRDGHPLWWDVAPKLKRYGYNVWVGKRGRVIAWMVS